MAEEVQYHHHPSHSDEPRDAAIATPVAPKTEDHEAVEATDRGLFGFMGKKEEKCEGEVMTTEFAEKVKVSEEKDEHKEEEEKKLDSLLENLHRSSSSSGSSSDEEEAEEGGEKKKKKGSKEKIKDKISGEKNEEPIKKCDDKPAQEPEEKKGLLDKIKEKLPGGKKADEVVSPPPTPAPVAAAECATTPEAEGKEKKGLLDKIKEKIPGYQSKSDEEKGKEEEEEGACH